MSKREKETSPLLSFEKEGTFDLWQEHMRALKTWDDLSLSRWLNQTLGQLHERAWRASHPLVVAYRLGATVAHQRDLWNRRTFTSNHHYELAVCCGAPQIPFVTFEVSTHGIYCSCCGEVLNTLDHFAVPLAEAFRKWGQTYEPIHQVAHWTDGERKKSGDYNKAFDQAFEKAIPLLAQLGYELTPQLLLTYPTVFWEDADNCLDVIPEDVNPPAT
jgi:hypothetical protein